MISSNSTVGRGKKKRMNQGKAHDSDRLTNKMKNKKRYKSTRDHIQGHKQLNINMSPNAPSSCAAPILPKAQLHLLSCTWLPPWIPPPFHLQRQDCLIKSPTKCYTQSLTSRMALEISSTVVM